jgi:hypothetical protein
MMSPQQHQQTYSTNHQHHHHHHQQSPQQIASCSSPLSVCSTPTTTTTTQKQQQQQSSATKRLCAVCSDMASGYHYGVWSCEGCKAFFKRSTQGEEPLYVCPATNSCTIDKQRRKSCQSCRLKKCFTVGMTKGNMRRERKQYNKRERKQQQPSSQQPQQQSITPSITITPSIESNNINDEKKEYLEIIEKLVSNEVIIDSKLELELEQNGLLKRIITISNTLNTNQQQLKQLIIDYVGKECIVLIRWAKTIHNYQTLNLNDQAHLIESNFMEILLLNFIWRTCIYNNFDLNMIYFHKQFKLNRFLCKELNLMNIFDSIIQICKNFIQLRVNIKEYLCLKTIILLKSG